MFLSDGTKRKLSPGIDDHSRCCLITPWSVGAAARVVWFALDLDRQVGAQDDCAITSGPSPDLSPSLPGICLREEFSDVNG